jgi:hypothetical protein
LRDDCPRASRLWRRDVDVDLSSAGGVATPAAATDGYSVAAAAGDGSDG